MSGGGGGCEGTGAPPLQLPVLDLSPDTDTHHLAQQLKVRLFLRWVFVHGKYVDATPASNHFLVWLRYSFILIAHRMIE